MSTLELVTLLEVSWQERDEADLGSGHTEMDGPEGTKVTKWP